MNMDGVQYTVMMVNGQRVLVPVHQPVQQQHLAPQYAQSDLARLYAEREAQRAVEREREIVREREIARLEALQRRGMGM